MSIKCVLRMQKLDLLHMYYREHPPPGRGEATHLTVDIEQCAAALPSCLAILADHILFFGMSSAAVSR